MTSQRPVSLSLNVRGLGQSATLAIKERCRELRRQGKFAYDFGLGQSPFPVPAQVVDALRLAANEKDYLPVRGLPALRAAIADFHRSKDQIDTHPDRVIVGPGSKELMFLLQIVFYGEILIPTPCWVSYVPQARIIGRRVSLLPTQFEYRWKLTPQEFLSAIELVHDDLRPRLLVLNYPSNPTGQTYSADELRELAEVARRFNIIVLSDEIYGQMHYAGEHVSIAQAYPEGTIVSSGLSKWCGAGGWRLGTIVFPPDLDWLLTAIAAVASETYTSVSAPIQHAAVQAFSGGMEMERYLFHTRRILQALSTRLVTLLRAAGVRVHDAEGGFYLFLDFCQLQDSLAKRGIQNAAMLCERLLSEAGVAILPGNEFGCPRESLTARLAFVNFDGARALAASERTPISEPMPDDFVERWCSRSVHGVQQIVRWLEGAPKELPSPDQTEADVLASDL